MLGAIAGDIIGSVYEWQNIKSKDFPLFSPDSCFTDDTVMTVAVAMALLSGAGLREYALCMRDLGRAYPDAGYGGRFRRWLRSPCPKPYGSYGNGSAMRVSPVGWFFDTLEETLDAAATSAAVTHDHPEGIRGAQAVAAAVFLARTGHGKAEVKRLIEERFGYDLSRRLDDIRPTYAFDGSCQGSVPEAIIAWLESTDFEDAIRNAISIGGDSDTIAAIAGGIAQAEYGMPASIRDEVLARLPNRFKSIIRMFESRVMA